MKSIFLTLPHDSFFLPILKRKLRKLGYKVIYFDYRFGDKIAKVIRLVFGQKMASLYINAKIIILIKKYKPNYFMTVKGESIHPVILKQINKGETETINWFPDPLNYWKIIKKISPHYDYFFHFDPFIVKKLKKEGQNNVYYLPFASEIHAGNEPMQYDISFVGSYDEHRVQNLLYLKEFNLNIWGDKKWYKSELKDFVKGGRVTPSTMHKIIKRSKINVNFYHQTTKGGTNLRTFQVVGCDAFLLTEYAKGLEDLFTVNKDIVCFKNPQELKTKAAFFLDNDLQRKMIADSGFIKCKNNHTYEIRLKQMFKIIYDNNLKKVL